VVVAVLALGAAGWYSFIRDDDSVDGNLPDAAEGSVGTIPPVVSAPPDAESTSLQELLQQGRDLTFHATYTASGDPAVIGSELTVEVWRKDGNIRQDTTQVGATTTSRSVGLVIGDETTTCSKIEDAPWSCSTASDPDATRDGVFGSVAAELNGVDVVETDEKKVGDRDARCFTFPAADGTGKLCLTPEGMPLSLSTSGLELTIASVDDNVDDAAFEPPTDS
jgi:hypothetical protein